MTDFDYNSPGEFYCRKHTGMGGSSGLSYRRFDTGAEAVRFAIENVSTTTLGGCTLEVDGERFGAREIKALYLSARYPLPRANYGDITQQQT